MADSALLEPDRRRLSWTIRGVVRPVAIGAFALILSLWMRSHIATDAIRYDRQRDDEVGMMVMVSRAGTIWIWRIELSGAGGPYYVDDGDVTVDVDVRRAEFLSATGERGPLGFGHYHNWGGTSQFVDEVAFGVPYWSLATLLVMPLALSLRRCRGRGRGFAIE